MSYSKTINVNGEMLDFTRPKVMGILNVTPDSFYAESRALSEIEITERIHQIVKEGADIIDIGGCSTRPNVELATEEEELSRLKFGLALIRKHYPEMLVSVDTFRSRVAEFCVKEHNVAIVNDISGGTLDDKMFATIAKLHVPYILMHIQGTPSTMQRRPHYKDVFRDEMFYFAHKTAQLNELGVSDIILDPGFGFGKTIDQNYELLNQLEGFQLFNLPILAGISRKSMIYKTLGTTPQESLTGTIALNMVALEKGANLLRVHDVREAVETVQLAMKISDNQKNK